MEIKDSGVLHVRSVSLSTEHKLQTHCKAK